MNADLKDKTIVITGGSSGIGAAAARILRQKGANIIITGRSSETKKIAEEIKSDYYLVDFSSFSSVKAFAKTLLEKYSKIDVLVNNVGGIIGNRRVTEDGHEQTLQVNYLSGFLLTLLLQQRLEESKALVINTSSMANNMGKIDFDDLESEKEYKPLKVYANAKLMNILHAMEINNRFKNVKAVSFHPGVVSTGFAREGNGVIKWAYETVLKSFFMISPEKGADTLVWFITTQAGNDWKMGEYYNKRKPGKKSPQANPAIAKKLWEASERLIK